MSAPFRLRIVSPEAVPLEAEALSVRFPGADGSIGVLPRHARMVSLTESGLLTARLADGKEVEYLIHDGFAAVRPESLTILTRSAEEPAAVDLDRARKAADRARERLRLDRSRYDLARAQSSLRRALVRQKYGRGR